MYDIENYKAIIQDLLSENFMLKNDNERFRSLANKHSLNINISHTQFSKLLDTIRPILQKRFITPPVNRTPDDDWAIVEFFHPEWEDMIVARITEKWVNGKREKHYAINEPYAKILAKCRKE